MILRFSTSDMLNCELINVATGQTTFHLVTNLTSIRVSASNCSETALDLIQCRKTLIRQLGVDAAEISWEGRKPGHLSIMGEELNGIQELFGKSTVRFE
jgi:hypothetical protein